MQNPLVSVIIPTHNNEYSIKNTLETIIFQDYDNVEIILINDASTDLTLNISKNILNKNNRPFKIINHEKNIGVSSARNDGIKNSNGKYILFCDADDLAEKNLISSLVFLIEKYECDISFCGFIDRFEDGKNDVKFPIELTEPYVRNSEEFLYFRIFNKIVPHLCSMLFRKNFLDENNLRFYDGCRAFEDIEFQLKTFCRAEKAVFDNRCLYIYMHNTEMGSVKNSDTKQKKLLRYSDSAKAHLRSATYLIKYSRSENIKQISKNLLLPEAIIKRFTVLAKNNDKKNFHALLRQQNVKNLLLNSRKSFFMNPEIFFKSIMILFFPGIYYYFRAKFS